MHIVDKFMAILLTLDFKLSLVEQVTCNEKKELKSWRGAFTHI